ncbi:hypothetical protein LZ31DRAFT_218675 [Colletotrichum somersetense]|nr:hypothetical protein LZ31DRAFT_218675 [Colletotrichum somersetense]
MSLVRRATTAARPMGGCCAREWRCDICLLTPKCRRRLVTFLVRGREAAPFFALRTPRVSPSLGSLVCGGGCNTDGSGYSDRSASSKYLLYVVLSSGVSSKKTGSRGRRTTCIVYCSPIRLLSDTLLYGPNVFSGHVGTDSALIASFLACWLSETTDALSLSLSLPICPSLCFCRGWV